MKNTPNYKKIYSDMISMKYPEKIISCEKFLKKSSFSQMDVIVLNSIITENSSDLFSTNQRLKSYDQLSIIKMLDYQKKHGISNIQLAKHFKTSRNSISKWKKMFSY
ncbi:helix-turn-helix domain-containing protein [uncultured Chryseobacterium sp.]|uniref:helix-turn-helix domain-containing protein n=1 Tax=uncultured Chryseobacterium sp. TaxID=259322 RepID=UPI0025872429|nr:helix-turn-helix domain-containing protein [uncultured Chryseobacterium sp.]